MAEDSLRVNQTTANEFLFSITTGRTQIRIITINNSFHKTTRLGDLDGPAILQ